MPKQRGEGSREKTVAKLVKEVAVMQELQVRRGVGGAGTRIRIRIRIQDQDSGFGFTPGTSLCL
jgi:hypothetical protein